METLHPYVPKDFVNSIDVLLDEAKSDLGFEFFDEDSSPQIYQGLSMLYFFSLGAKIHEAGKSKTILGDGSAMLTQLDKENLISPKPTNYVELKETFEKLFDKTSDYLRKVE